MTARQVLTASQTEAEFQQAVVDLAHTRHWKVFHARTVQLSSGEYLTAQVGESGFLDLVMARAGRVILAELKKIGGRPSPEQLAWLSALSGVKWTSRHTAVEFCAVDGMPAVTTVALWTPKDWAEIERVLL